MLQVSEETGIPYDTLFRLMKGTRAIRVAALVQIATSVGTTAGQILDKAEQELARQADSGK